MQWTGGRRSTNIEDRRGMRVGPMAIGGGLGTLVIVLLGLLFGIDPSAFLNTTSTETEAPSGTTAGINDETRDFVSAVVGYTEDSWADIFRAGGRSYRAPNVVLYTGAVESACGFGQAAMGPFYCPGDEKVYLDLSFFQELRDRFHAPGDFAQAYVIAHEVGHHVQNLLGISKQVESVRSRASEAEANRISVKLELQADCLAGVWANHTEKAQNSQAKAFLDPGDVEEALQAASMIGDDKLQKRSQGYVVPESFTHGSSAQRVQWFRQGFEAGNFEACNTFN